MTNVTATIEHYVVTFCPNCGNRMNVPTAAAPVNAATGTVRCDDCELDYTYTVNTSL